jgi:hypothetical protein
MDTHSARQQHQPNEGPASRGQVNGRVQGNLKFHIHLLESALLRMMIWNNIFEKSRCLMEEIGDAIGREPRNVREHYKKYLSHNPPEKEFAFEENQKLLKLVNKYGHKWSMFRDKYFPNRSDIFLKTNIRN